MSEKRKYKKRLIWNEEEERSLLDIWKGNFGKLRELRKNYHIYEEMASELRNQGWTVSAYEVQTKIRNLGLKFRAENKKIGPSGGSRSKWVLFNAVKEILEGNKSNSMDSCKEETLDESSINEPSQTSRSGWSDEISPPSPALSPARKRKKKLSAKKEMVKAMMKMAETAERKVRAMEERNRLKAEELRLKAEKWEFLKSQTKFVVRRTNKPSTEKYVEEVEGQETKVRFEL